MFGIRSERRYLFLYGAVAILTVHIAELVYQSYSASQSQSRIGVNLIGKYPTFAMFIAISVLFTAFIILVENHDQR